MKKEKSVLIEKGVRISKKKKEEMKKKPGGSNIGVYKKVSKADFAGPAGGAPMGTFPINTKSRARAALAYAHNAPNPAGIKAKVYKAYPSLRKENEKRNEKKSC